MLLSMTWACPSALAFDSSNRLFLSGFTNTNSAQGFSNWCTVPTDNSFPVCNANSLNYMEPTINNPLGRKQTFIAAFSGNNNLLWSSFFGDGLQNTGRSVSAGSSKLFLAGRSQESWTLYEFNPSSDEDYWQPNYIGSDDGTIARFDIPTIVGVNEAVESHQGALLVFPNPSNTEWITIRGADFANSFSRIEVFDAVGKRVLSIPMLSSDGSFVINIGDLPPGLYIASVSNASKSQACRFVKQ
ncbi:MAG: T9SS type A sorting domain-containing protein [Flavobacteriales bacterium]